MNLDELSGYPCPYVIKGPCTNNPGPGCPLGHKESCSVLPIYRAHIALRAAVLGDMTPAEAAEMYRRIGDDRENASYVEIRDKLNALADVVETLRQWTSTRTPKRCCG